MKLTKQDVTKKPQVVTICGSTRFIDELNYWRKRLTEYGYIVISIELVTTQARSEDPQHVNPELKAMLDELHLRKIDLADWVLVLNVGGYIGESTAREIAYCWDKQKQAVFVEDHFPSCLRYGNGAVYGIPSDRKLCDILEDACPPKPTGEGEAA